MREILIAWVVALGTASAARAQMVEMPEDPPAAGSGQDKASGYMRDRKSNKAAAAAPAAEKAADPDGPAARYLDVHFGGFFDSQAYRWGDGDQNNIGKFIAGVDYRLGEWVNTADLMLRVDYQTYALDEGDARKLSIGGIVTFPDANSRFPLYFGVGLGAGFFLKQIHDSSAMSIDYSILAGARFLNVFDRLGFMVETGLKDHLHLFSEGQFNGIYINVGTVWMF
jgi:hypothetical protein